MREQEEPAMQMMLKPHRTERRGEMFQTMQERTGQVRESMQQGGGSYGPIVVGLRGSAVGRSDDPRAMTGMEYGETSINTKAGVNTSEYGNKGAAWNVMCVLSVCLPSPAALHRNRDPDGHRVTRSHAWCVVMCTRAASHLTSCHSASPLASCHPPTIYAPGATQFPAKAVGGEDHLGQPKA